MAHYIYGSKYIKTQVLVPVCYWTKERKASQHQPERNHVAELGRQTPDLIRWQVQVHQVVEFGDVWWDARQWVVAEVQGSEVG